MLFFVLRVFLRIGNTDRWPFLGTDRNVDILLLSANNQKFFDSINSGVNKAMFVYPSILPNMRTTLQLSSQNCNVV